MSQPGHAFSGTHHAPPTGLETWPEPGAPQQGPRLDPYLPVRVVRTRGDWGEIVCANGWTAWVDVRRLVPLAPTGSMAAVSGASQPVAPGAATGPFVAPSARTVPTLVGAGAVVLAVFLPWIDAGRGASTVNALDVPLTFLLSRDNIVDGGPGLGITLAVLAVLAALLRHARGAEKFARIPGALCVPAVVMFAVQMNSLLDLSRQAGVPGVPSLFDVLGTGVWVGGAGALLVAFGTSR